jgi:hypothetical protein
MRPIHQFGLLASSAEAPNPVPPPMHRARFLIAIVALACTVSTGNASASMTDVIIRDCEHSASGLLTGTYTRAQLIAARNNLPGDVAEYSGCYDAINQALVELSPKPRKGGGGTALGGSFSGNAAMQKNGRDVTREDHRTAAPGEAGDGRPVKFADGTIVAPGVVPGIGRSANPLPASVIVLLAALGAMLCLVLVVGIARAVGHLRSKAP